MLKNRVIAVSIIAAACSTSIYAATPVDLSHQPVTTLQNFVSTKTISSSHATLNSVKEISSNVDFNQTKHIRIKQTYAGHEVWGSDAVVHIPQGKNNTLTKLTSQTTMNGLMYQGIEKDLNNMPAYITSVEQGKKVFNYVIESFQKKTGITKIDDTTAQKNLIVYIDKDNKAHWAYYITFAAASTNGLPSVPTYIIDATTLTIYKQWNNLQTETVQGGGYGGNEKMQRIIYDGAKMERHFPILTMKRDAAEKTCTLQNNTVVVKDHNHKDGFFGDASPAEFTCTSPDSQYGNIYWNGESDSVNGAFSPANDALYIGKVIDEMYRNWYGIPALLNIFGMPKKLMMNVHVKDFSGEALENAYFHPLFRQMYFGDGGKMLYPLTSLGVGAHEISHGFTSQHSNLVYEKESGGLNESFSDMAAQAAEYYSQGHNDWQIGPEIFKEDRALRYMDDPTKDGKSIGHIKDYNDELNVHHSSGVFNKAFYLLATAQGWNTKKAFDVMVAANMNYWTAEATFQTAACGVLSAAKDLQRNDASYTLDAVKNAMNGVGISLETC